LKLVRVLVAGLLVAAPAAAVARGPQSGNAASCPVPAALSFASPTYVDRTRAGGEPLVATHPSGRLFYSAHAGTTHFFAPAAAAAGSAALAQNYTGQTYVWTSDDNGKTWTFRPRILPGQGAPLSGFSDPEFAIDSAGQVFFSEINLANVAVSKSTDRATTFSLQNLAGAVLTDRQWMEADRKDEVYFVANGFGGGTGSMPIRPSGHYIAKSTDGGKTFTPSVDDNEGGEGLGDIRVDKRNGTVYEAHYFGTNLSMAAFRHARTGDLTATDTNLIASGVKLVGHWPAFDLDPAGNLYVTWDESGTGARPAGIWYSRSTDGGRTWADPTRVDRDSRTDIWPWIAVGDAGQVGIMWLEADHKLPGGDPETVGTYGWRLVGAVTANGLGCGMSATPGFSVATATKDPMHVGAICQGGTDCLLDVRDRRLGDYFSVDLDSTGHLYAGYADTRVAAGVALPAFVRQSEGSLLRVTGVRKGAPPSADKPIGPAAEGRLAATGSGPSLALGAALLVLLAFVMRGRPLRDSRLN